MTLLVVLGLFLTACSPAPPEDYTSRIAPERAPKDDISQRWRLPLLPALHRASHLIIEFEAPSRVG